MLLSDAGDGIVLEQCGGVIGLLPLEFEEGLRTEGGICGDGDVLSLGEINKVLLDEVWVVLWVILATIQSGWWSYNIPI